MINIYYRYRLHKQKISDEQGNKFNVYGIEAVTFNGKILATVEDLFFIRREARKFVFCCNKHKLSLIHLKNAAEDVLAEKYAV